MEHDIERKRISFICIKGLDSFIYDIIKGLSEDYEVKKFIIENSVQVIEAVDWGDVIWLEWANESSIIATNYEGIKNKKVILRIHGYEIFTDMPSFIRWNVLDRVIFVADHKREIFFERFKDMTDFNKTTLIRNGIDIMKFTIPERKGKNKNMAFVGNINYRKGIELLLQLFYELVEIDNGYKLYIRGDHQDLRYKVAIENMIDELGIKDKVIFEDRVDDLNKWFEDKTYIVSSSIEESFQYTIGEGMLSGLKPVIHAWKESRDIWPKEYIYKNREEFLKIVLNDEYCKEDYREFVVKNYSLENQLNNIRKILK